MELSSEQKAAIEEQKQYCPFCKIVKGEIPASKFYEDNLFIAILDINPASTGHTLLIPKEHYPVFPFLPDKERDQLASLLPTLGAALSGALVTRGCDYFVANGAAAGQQTSHLLVHIFPSDSSRFPKPSTPSERADALKATLSARFAGPKEKLGQLLSSNPQLRELLVERPRDFIQQLSSVPDLATLFTGVDIAQLSKQLSETDTPRAAQMEDEAFTIFLTGKDKLRELLLADPEGLADAIKTQPKLQRFFTGSTVEEVRARYEKLFAVAPQSSVQPRPQSDASLPSADSPLRGYAESTEDKTDV